MSCRGVLATSPSLRATTTTITTIIRGLAALRLTSSRASAIRVFAPSAAALVLLLAADSRESATGGGWISALFYLVLLRFSDTL